VLGDDERISVEVLDTSGKVALEVDGQFVETVGPSWRMTVAQHDEPARVVRLGDGGFAERARRKLGISDPAGVADPGVV